MMMPGRNDNTPEYRYGFNGMEKDDEVTEQTGTSYDFGARLYNPRVGRWLSVDPQENMYPFLCPYNYVANSPMMYVDPDGEKIRPVDSQSWDLIDEDFQNFHSNLTFRSSKYQDMDYIQFFGLTNDDSRGFNIKQPGKGSVHADGGTLTTDLSKKQIRKRVRSIKGRESRKQAKAMFKLLSSEYIVQVRKLGTDAPAGGIPETPEPIPVEGGSLGEFDKRKRSAINDPSKSQENKEAINDAVNKQILQEPGETLITDKANYVPSFGGEKFMNGTERIETGQFYVPGTINLTEETNLFDVILILDDKNLIPEDTHDEPNQDHKETNIEL
jgi:RHS repeat-associated protein